MTTATCSVPDCDKPVKRPRTGFCYAHYMKNYRYGTPTPVHAPTWLDLHGARYGTLTVVERVGKAWRCVCDCGGERLVMAGELNRTGDGVTCGDRTIHYRADTVGYTGAHARCVTDFGKASTHPCVDCGHPAYHWSYNHTDPDELYAHGLCAHPVAYSLDTTHYSPRCVPCHKRYDLHRTTANDS